MICDVYENSARYYGCHKGFQTGFEFIKRAVEEDLPLGKYMLDGTDIYAMIMEYIPNPDSEKFEGHRDYIDIQYIVSGQERMDCADVSNCSTMTEYNPEKDVEFFTCNGMKATMSFEKGGFAVFFPWDIHKPSVILDKPETVKKIVVKVRV